MRRDKFPIVEEYCKDKIIEELEKIKGKIIINDNFEWVFSGRKFIEKKQYWTSLIKKYPN